MCKPPAIIKWHIFVCRERIDEEFVYKCSCMATSADQAILAVYGKGTMMYLPRGNTPQLAMYRPIDRPDVQVAVAKAHK